MFGVSPHSESDALRGNAKMCMEMALVLDTLKHDGKVIFLYRKTYTDCNYKIVRIYHKFCFIFMQSPRVFILQQAAKVPPNSLNVSTPNNWSIYVLQDARHTWACWFPHVRSTFLLSLPQIKTYLSLFHIHFLLGLGVWATSKFCALCWNRGAGWILFLRE